MKDLYTMISTAGFLPILFAEADCAGRVIRAIERTEMPVVEILQRDAAAAAALKEAVQMKRRAWVGAGTVCTLDHCKEMVDLGADFIVSPGYNAEVVDWCVQRGIPVIPGVSTPTEVMLAANAGVRLAKFFPFRELGGEAYLSGISGPFPALRFVITGGLDARDLRRLANPKIAAVGGVWPFQSETDHTVVEGAEIERRIRRSMELGSFYRSGADAV